MNILNTIKRRGGKNPGTGPRRHPSRPGPERQPTVSDAYAAVRAAKDLLDRIPDVELASAKRQARNLEDTLWQLRNAR